MVNSADVSATVATRARIVLWCAEGRLKKQVAMLVGVSRPTVDLWLNRYETEGSTDWWTDPTRRLVSRFPRE